MVKLGKRRQRELADQLLQQFNLLGPGSPSMASTPIDELPSPFLPESGRQPGEPNHTQYTCPCGFSALAADLDGITQIIREHKDFHAWLAAPLSPPPDLDEEHEEEIKAWAAEIERNICQTCGEEIRVQIFRDSHYCSTNCAKAGAA